MDVNTIPIFNPVVFVTVALAPLVMVVAIVGIVFWYKARQRELQVHQDMRMREMEHQRGMKELELEIEKTKARQGAERAA